LLVIHPLFLDTMSSSPNMKSSVLPPINQKKSYLRLRKKDEKHSNRALVKASLDSSLHETKPPIKSFGELQPVHLKRPSLVDPGNSMNDSWANMDVEMDVNVRYKEKTSDVVHAPRGGNAKLPQRSQSKPLPSSLNLDSMSPDDGKSRCYPKRQRPKAAIAA
jgi:hypothetical protein